MWRVSLFDMGLFAFNMLIIVNDKKLKSDVISYIILLGKLPCLIQLFIFFLREAIEILCIITFKN